MVKKTIYQLPKALKWILSVLLITLGFGVIMPLFMKPYGLLLLPLLAPYFNLISVPFFRMIGYYKYLNPFVLSTVQTDKNYDLHNVFTFDYLLNFKWSDRGRYVQRMLLAHYFKALLTIVERIENGKLSPDVTIVGHSYFFNERTAKKLGFTLSKAPFFWVFNSALQFIELSYLYSFSQGKLALPKFWKVKRAEIKGQDLLTQKDTLERLVKMTLPERNNDQ